MQLIYSSLGLVTVFLMASYLIYVRNVSLSPGLINLSTYCFGIYLFQQFILYYIYYRTDVLSMISIEALPWISFVAALVLSYLFTMFTLKTRVGRYLIG